MASKLHEHPRERKTNEYPLQRGNFHDKTLKEFPECSHNLTLLLIGVFQRNSIHNCRIVFSNCTPGDPTTFKKKTLSTRWDDEQFICLIVFIIIIATKCKNQMSYSSLVSCFLSITKSRPSPLGTDCMSVTKAWNVVLVVLWNVKICHKLVCSCATHPYRTNKIAPRKWKLQK